MKKLFLIFFLLSLLTFAVQAQTERGRYVIGGNVDISGYYQGKNSGFNMSIAPSFGVFVVKGFVVGGRYSFGISSSKIFDNNKKAYNSSTTFTSGVGPLLKYYIGKKQLKGLISANVNYLTSITMKKSSTDNKSVTGTSGYSAMGLAGMAYFFNPNLSLECGLYLSGTGYIKQLPITRIGFSIGLFAFLDKKKKQ